MTTEELKDLRTRVLEAINRELQPTRMTDEELLKAITSLVDRESRGDYLLPIQKMAVCWIPSLRMKISRRS